MTNTFIPTTAIDESRGFPSQRGSGTPPAGLPTRSYLCEVFGIGKFHKLGLVEDTATGRAWCLQSDEGASLGGTNLAPAPLFIWLAGIQADVAARIAAIARARGIVLESLVVGVSQGFASQGSFARGEAIAHVYGLDWDIDIRGAGSGEERDALVEAALRSSPSVATMLTAEDGLFALHTNGRRTSLDGGLAVWTEPTVEDPLRRHSTLPEPTGEPAELVFRFEPGEGVPATAAEKIATHSSSDAGSAPLGFHVDARGELDLETGMMRTLTGLPDMTNDRWEITSDPEGELAPTPLALVAIGTAFCYHTQLSRYVTVRRLDLKNSSLAQLTTYEPVENDSAQAAVARPVLTNMFLNGGESEEATRSLLEVAANTCYVHRAMSKEVEMTADVTWLSSS